MDNYLSDIIKNTKDYIEKNNLTDLNLDIISENVNVSKFHLLRIWKSTTSYGLMEYVRKRRIALTLNELMESNTSIEYISYKYKFGCERTYIRIFKEEFQITPSKWRKNPIPLNTLDIYNYENY